MYKFDQNKMLVLDIDTIKAFMSQGALYNPNTESIKSNLFRITHMAPNYGIKILSLCDRHYGTKEYAKAEIELKINGGPFELHAIGEEAEKIPETLLTDNIVYIPTDLQIEEYNLRQILSKCNQIIVEKQSICGFYINDNLGGNPLLTRILSILQPQDIFVQGVYTEYSILENVMPFLAGGDVNVWIVLDAIAPYNIKSGEYTLKDLASMHARFINTDKFIRLLENNFGFINNFNNFIN